MVTPENSTQVMEDMLVAGNMGNTIVLPTWDVLINGGAQTGGQGWGTTQNTSSQRSQYVIEVGPGLDFSCLRPTLCRVRII